MRLLIAKIGRGLLAFVLGIWSGPQQVRALYQRMMETYRANRAG